MNRRTIEKVIPGFTLIELMITIAVAAILLAIAVPSFTGLLNRNNASAEATELVAALNLARSEAIKRNRTVGVSAINGNWGQGYLIATTVAPIESIKQIQLNSQNSPPVEQSSPPLTSVIFAGTGALSTATATPQFQICKATGDEGRQINISSTGRISSSVVPSCT